jgi:hypothetical protein
MKKRMIRGTFLLAFLFSASIFLTGCDVSEGLGVIMSGLGKIFGITGSKSSDTKKTDGQEAKGQEGEGKGGEAKGGETQEPTAKAGANTGEPAKPPTQSPDSTTPKTPPETNPPKNKYKKAAPIGKPTSAKPSATPGPQTTSWTDIKRADEAKVNEINLSNDNAELKRKYNAQVQEKIDSLQKQRDAIKKENPWYVPKVSENAIKVRDLETQIKDLEGKLEK